MIEEGDGHRKCLSAEIGLNFNVAFDHHVDAHLRVRGRDEPIEAKMSVLDF